MITRNWIVYTKFLDLSVPGIMKMTKSQKTEELNEVGYRVRSLVGRKFLFLYRFD